MKEYIFHITCGKVKFKITSKKLFLVTYEEPLESTGLKVLQGQREICYPFCQGKASCGVGLKL